MYIGEIVREVELVPLEEPQTLPLPDATLPELELGRPSEPARS